VKYVKPIKIEFGKVFKPQSHTNDITESIAITVRKTITVTTVIVTMSLNRFRIQKWNSKYCSWFKLWTRNSVGQSSVNINI